MAAKAEEVLSARALTRFEKLQVAVDSPELRGKFRAAMRGLVMQAILGEPKDEALHTWAQTHAKPEQWFPYVDFIYEGALYLEPSMLEQGADDAEVSEILARYLPKLFGVVL